MSRGKVIPEPDDLNLEFFRTIVQTGTMHLQRCGDCGAHTMPPRYYCPACFSSNQHFVPVSGTGTVYSHTVSRFTAEEAWKAEVPYATVVIQLDEGPRIVGSARIADPTAIRIGQRVRVVPEARSEEFAFFTVEFGDVG